MTINTKIILALFPLVTICTCIHTFVANTNLDSGEDDLVSVAVLFRHGDRSPISSFPDDPYHNISYWPEGYGQLLSKGISRHYDLGQWFRKRYDTFLPSEYSPKDIIVYSTDVDRTLMSAEANLAGLYPPTNSQIWEEGFSWEPIPVHLLASDDPILAMNSECPKFDKLQEELEASDFFKNVALENNDLFSNLSYYTGMNITLGDISMIYSVFYVYRSHNASYIPSWADEIDLDKLTYLAGLHLSKPTFTEELSRFSAGPFFNYLINHFNDVINNVTNTKFLMLSGHDGTLATVMGGMKAFDYHPPEFASTIIWELRRNISNDYYINVLYKRNSTDTYEKLIVDTCELDCAFEEFKTTLEPIAVDTMTWQTECQDHQGSHSFRNGSSWFLILVAIIYNCVSK